MVRLISSIDTTLGTEQRDTGMCFENHTVFGQYLIDNFLQVSRKGTSGLLHFLDVSNFPDETPIPITLHYAETIKGKYEHKQQFYSRYFLEPEALEEAINSSEKYVKETFSKVIVDFDYENVYRSLLVK
jgi:hypothetical protein